jgi:hypothetical protein
MYQNPTLFSPVSNRESFGPIIVQIADDDTGDLIALTDQPAGAGNALYGLNLEIMPSHPHRGPPSLSPWYDDCDGPVITGSLANYISIVDTGTFQILVPKSVMKTLHAGRTYDIFMTITTNGEDDGRQLWIGRLPVLYGGRNT